MAEWATKNTIGEVTLKPSLSGKQPRSDRFIYLYLPDLPLRRLARERQIDPGAPLALYEAQKGADRLVYCNQSALSFGLAPGMSLSDARALCALCHFHLTAHDADRHWLHQLARWCWRYSPVVGVDPDRLGLWIESTGADHLWGGEAKMIADIASHFAQDNGAPTAHIAMASSYGAALGLAISYLPSQPLMIADTPKAHHEALSDLPLSALRLSEPQIAELAQIGMGVIGDLARLKRGMLAMRFGEDIIRRRDQMFGHVPECPVPLTQLNPVIIQQQYHEPISGLASLEQMIDSLLTGLSQMLSQMMLGCRVIEIGWQTIDGHHDHISHKLSRPSRDRRLFGRLFQEAATLIDAGFGIEHSWIKAGALSAQMPQSLTFDKMFDEIGEAAEPGQQGQHNHSRDTDDDITVLVDHLAARLGSARVQKLTLLENWIPEQSETFTIAQAEITDTLALSEDTPDMLGVLCVMDEASSSPRPMRLLTPPEPIQAIALLPDHPPSQIRWRKQNWRISRATGPERIGPRWWQAGTSDRGASDEVISRDYYRLETQTGHRLWVYRLGLPERGEAVRWYLHGLFA